MSALLDVDDLSVEFRVGPAWRRQSIQAVAGVSFSLPAGKTFALVGESGSGKTTLARAINALQPIASGSVSFKGVRIDQLTRTQMKPHRRRMAMMFQDPMGSLSPRMTISELLAEPFRIHRDAAHDIHEQTRQLLAQVGLPAAYLDRYPHQLSGGQARRVGVARAIALNPALIVADEPTAGLDVSVQGEILNLMMDLRERMNLAMLFITHNLHVVHHVADHVAVMYLGRFVERGPTREVFATPKHPYTQALLSANPEPDPDRVHTRITLPAEVPSLLARPGGCEFHPRCPRAQSRCSVEAPVTSDNGAHVVSCHFPLTAGQASAVTR
jgi:peptide/nickel transport system ATP-binding protein